MVASKWRCADVGLTSSVTSQQHLHDVVMSTSCTCLLTIWALMSQQEKKYCSRVWRGRKGRGEEGAGRAVGRTGQRYQWCGVNIYTYNKSININSTSLIPAFCIFHHVLAINHWRSISISSILFFFSFFFYCCRVGNKLDACKKNSNGVCKPV